jgi:uncharacterized protein YndB with AHSA1/START domain
MSGNSVTLHRVIKASPEKVYRAFTDAHALASWMPPYGFVGIVHHMDVKAGGTFKMSFQNFSTGKRESFGGEYIEVIPNKFLKYTDKFEDESLPGTIVNSIWLGETSVGTDLKILQENIPEMIPAEMCYLGWQESLEKLIKLVEPQIPDA